MTTSPNQSSARDQAPAADALTVAQEGHQTMAGLIFAALAMPTALRSTDTSVPLTIVSGFLGAGKTTLLNRLLSQPGGRRLVALVNDFGRINIDADLVSSRTDDVISLTNGCACCAVAGDLTQALIEIAQRDDAPDAIVLETSGLADPRGVAQIALANPAIRLDGVVVLVDAETVRDRAADERTARLLHDQVAAADVVALTKTDLADDERRAAAADWLAATAAATPVIEAVDGDVPADVVLGVAAVHSPDDFSASPPDHADGFCSWSFEVDGVLDAERLREVVDSLPGSLLRAKGLLWLSDRPERRTVFQQVGARQQYAVGGPWGADTPRSNFVFIGPTGWIDRPVLAAQLAACRAEAPA